jgi:hypothetical protein
MRTAELGDSDALEIRQRQLRAGAGADMHESVGEPRERGDTASKVVTALRDDALGRGSQRLALERRHEERARSRAGIGNAREGSGAQSRPEPGGQHQRLQPLARQRRQRLGSDALERLRCVALERDLDRLEDRRPAR